MKRSLVLPFFVAACALEPTTSTDQTQPLTDAAPSLRAELDPSVALETTELVASTMQAIESDVARFVADDRFESFTLTEGCFTHQIVALRHSLVSNTTSLSTTLEAVEARSLGCGVHQIVDDEGDAELTYFYNLDCSTELIRSAEGWQASSACDGELADP